VISGLGRRDGAPVILGILVTLGCTTESVRPGEHAASADRAVVRRAIEAALTGLPDFPSQGSRSLPLGLRERIELLEAVTAPARDERLARAQDLSERTADPLFEKSIQHLLAQDDAWLARSIDGERVQTFWSAIGDGVLRIGVAALQGNPIGVARPLVEGVDGLMRPDRLDALDRKQLALSRRWLVTHPSGVGLPDGAEDVQRRTRELREAVFEQELELFRVLLEDGKIDAAAAHLHVASIRQPQGARVRSGEIALEHAVERAAARVSSGMAVSPAEPELRLAADPGLATCRWIVEELLLRRADGDDVAAAASGARGAGWGDVADSLARTAARLEAEPDPWAGVVEAEAELGRRKRRYVFTGRRTSDDPTTRYAEAADTGGFVLTDIFVPLLWAPATLTRAISLGIGSPVEDGLVVDALAAVAWSTPDDAVRKEAVRRLSRRYAARGEVEEALEAARAVPLSEAELAELAEDASRQAFDRADGEGSTAMRRAALASVTKRYPGTEAAARSDERAAELAAPEFADAIHLPPVALAPIADRLGVAPHLVDGRPLNGEIESPGFRVLADRIEWELRVEEATVHESMAFDAELAAEVAPILEEWEWRRRVARSSTFAGAHEGVPVEFRAGIGFEGVNVLPRLLPEVYRGRDRALYEP